MVKRADDHSPLVDAFTNLALSEGNMQAACGSISEALKRFEALNSPEAEEPREMLRRLGCEL